MEVVTQTRCFFYEMCRLSLAVSMISARHLLERKWAGNILVNTIDQYTVLKHDLNTHAGLILLH